MMKVFKRTGGCASLLLGMLFGLVVSSVMASEVGVVSTHCTPSKACSLPFSRPHALKAFISSVPQASIVVVDARKDNPKEPRLAYPYITHSSQLKPEHAYLIVHGTRDELNDWVIQQSVLSGLHPNQLGGHPKVYLVQFTVVAMQEVGLPTKPMPHKPWCAWCRYLWQSWQRLNDQ